jgi:hypothetical protein
MMAVVAYVVVPGTTIEQCHQVREAEKIWAGRPRRRSRVTERYGSGAASHIAV